MTPWLLDHLCDPESGEPLKLLDAVTSPTGQIVSGRLVSSTGNFPIVDGVPRFVPQNGISKSVEAFGDEWNFFNYDQFKANWLKHVAIGSFGSPDYFKDKIVVDCGAGSGMQTRWIAEAGARRVIALELSHSVDGVMRQNLDGLENVDIIQCSIDAPPLRRSSIDGLVLCHNVIQHTPSVAKTANALWGVVAGGGEFAFNCYLKYPNDPVWMARWLLIGRPLRFVLSRCPFGVRLAYARTVARLRQLPVIGPVLEKMQIVIRGDVPDGDRFEQRQFESAVLNTFDWYGGHTYQHQLSARDLGDICRGLMPAPASIQNLDAYERRGTPPGLPLRLVKRG